MNEHEIYLVRGFECGGYDYYEIPQGFLDDKVHPLILPHMDGRKYDEIIILAKEDYDELEGRNFSLDIENIELMEELDRLKNKDNEQSIYYKMQPGCEPMGGIETLD